MTAPSRLRRRKPIVFGNIMRGPSIRRLVTEGPIPFVEVEPLRFLTQQRAAWERRQAQ